MVPEAVRFGKYLLLERISVGGMAEVFKAKSYGVEGFEKILAIKRILPAMTQDAEFIQMFIDEAKIAGRLNHANICQIYELGRIDNSHFIAMEYIWGKDLLQMQNKYRKLGQAMPLGQVSYICSKVCEGLDYAHKKKDPAGNPLNIIHRDITPQNVLVSYEGEVKVIDFGIAKARNRSSKTAAGVLKGKFGYMSPEQVRGLPLDRRSDIFSLGILLYELATGTRLFDAETDFATLEKVRTVDVIPPTQVNPAITPDLEEIIYKALKKNPEDRYQWASEMQAALTGYLMSLHPVYTAKMMASWMRKNFMDEIGKERAMLEQLLRMEQEGRLVVDRERASSGPVQAIRRSRSMPPVGLRRLSEVGEGDEEQTIMTDSPFLASAETVMDDEEPTRALPGGPKEMSHAPTAILDEESNPMLHAQKTQMLDEESNPMLHAQQTQMLDEENNPMLHAQQTQMLDEDDPNRPRLFPITDTQSIQTEKKAEEEEIRDKGIGEGEEAIFAPPLGMDSGHVKKGENRLVRDLIIGVPVAVVCFALGALIMKCAAGDKKKPAAPRRGTLVLFLPQKVNAKVFLSDKLKADVEAAGKPVVLDVEEGTYQVKVTAQGHADKSFELKLSPQQVFARVVELEPAPRSDKPEARPPDPGGGKKEALEARPEARPDDKKDETASKDKPASDEPDHSEQSGSRRRRKRKKRAPDKAPSPEPPRPAARKDPGSCDPRCPHKDKGCLWANSSPKSRIYVNGRNTGRWTPLFGSAALKLKPGSYRISFVLPSGVKKSYSIRVRACKITRLVRQLN